MNEKTRAVIIGEFNMIKENRNEYLVPRHSKNTPASKGLILSKAIWKQQHYTNDTETSGYLVSSLLTNHIALGSVPLLRTENFGVNVDETFYISNSVSIASYQKLVF